jgi:hypothetical protein
MIPSMTPAQREALRAAAPSLYRVQSEKPPSPFAFFGFESPAGWYELVLDASRKLEAEIQAQPEAERAQYSAKQVKSKFGMLCLYMGPRTPAMDAILTEAEHRSLETCETCGRSATRHTVRGWIVTACPEHAPKASRLREQ